MYIFTAFASPFPYTGIEVGAVATGIMVAGIIACRGRDNRLRGGIG